MRCESRFGSGEQPTTAHTRVPVRMARTSSTCGSSGDSRVDGHAAALGEAVEHERGVGDRDAGQVLLARLEVGDDRRASHAGVRLAVATGERGDGVARRGRTPPSRRSIPSAARRARLVVAVGQRRRARAPSSAGGESPSSAQLLAHVGSGVLAGQDRRLGVADQAAEAARRAPPPTRRGRRWRRGAAARARPRRPAARAAPRRRRRSPRAWRPRGAPSRQQCSQSAGRS